MNDLTSLQPLKGPTVGSPSEHGNTNVAESVSETSKDWSNIIDSDVRLGTIPCEYYISF